MKHRMMTLAVLLLTAGSLMAQKPCEKCEKKTPEQRTEQRTMHMVQALQLNDAQAAQFTKLYSQYRAEMREAQSKYPMHRGKNADKGTNGENVKESKEQRTDAEIRKSIENQFALTQATLNIRQKYYTEYLKFMSPRQIERLFQMEKAGAQHLRKAKGHVNMHGKGGQHGPKGKPGFRPQPRKK